MNRPRKEPSWRLRITLVAVMALWACSSDKETPAAACARGAPAQCNAACDKGDGPSCRILGAMYLEGRGVETDIERGLALLARACDLGVREACGPMDPSPGDDQPPVPRPTRVPPVQKEQPPPPEPEEAAPEPSPPPPKRRQDG